METSKEDREFYDAYIRANSPGYPYEVPKPGEPQCEADGVRNGPDGPGGTEHYWTCTTPGTIDVDGELLCEVHAGERRHGPIAASAKLGYNEGVGERFPAGRIIMAATVTIDLAAAGLTHAKGKSDKCGTDGHDVDWLSVTTWDNPDLVDANDVHPVLQALHEQAHPDGAAYWQNCRERGCADVDW